MCWSPCSAGRRCLRRRAEPVHRASWKVCLETMERPLCSPVGGDAYGRIDLPQAQAAGR